MKKCVILAVVLLLLAMPLVAAYGVTFYNPAWNPQDGRVYDEYVKKLTLLHKMLIYSMKAKQTTDLENVEKLRSLLKDFRLIYLAQSN